MWVIVETTGDYSGYTIKAIWATRELADKINASLGAYNEIEVFELDAAPEIAKKGMAHNWREGYVWKDEPCEDD